MSSPSVSCHRLVIGVQSQKGTSPVPNSYSHSLAEKGNLKTSTNETRRCNATPKFHPYSHHLSLNLSPFFFCRSFFGRQKCPRGRVLKFLVHRAAIVEPPALLSVSAMSQSVSLPPHSSSSSTVTVSSSPNLGPANSQTPANPFSFMPGGLSVTPGIPGTPGLVPPSPVIFPSAAIGSATTAVQRPNMINPSVSNIVIQQQTSPILPSLPPFAASPQGHWLQLSQMVGVSRPPYLPYPAVFSGPFHLTAHDIPQSSDSQTPGITSAGTTDASLTFSAASVNPLIGTLGIQAELPPGIDANPSVGTPGMQTELRPGNDYIGHGIGSNENATINESLEAWTVHKTDAGVVYYYNAVTGVSTYQKPLGLKGGSDVTPVQPTPVSMKSFAGTDWALITTSDGKKYYYNNKTKLTSWQIPSEVTEFRKRQEADLSKDNALTVPHTDAPVEKVSTPISGTTINSRDGAVSRASIVPGSASALDLIKKKLQDSGTPVTSSPAPVTLGLASSESNGPQVVEAMIKGLHSENSKDKLREANGDGNMTESSSDSEDEDDGPTKEECIIQFKEMLKERGVAPFSKWEKELPKIVFDPRFKAIPSHSARRSLFERYVKTRAEEERKEKRAAQRAAIEGFKQLLEEASQDIDQNTDYQTFKKKWGIDPRFLALDRKDRENLLNERVLPLKRAAQEKAGAERAAAAASFKSMLRDRGDINVNSRWSRVKDGLRNDPRYRCVKHEDREVLFNEYLYELKSVEAKAELEAKAKKDEQEKLKERERELRKRKEREEQEMERLRAKVRRKEAVASFQALLVETIKDPLASWTESKPKLEKDPQRRATNPDFDSSDTEKLFREHIKMLYERCMHDFKALLAEVITAEAAAQRTEDGKTVLDSWSTAKRLLKPDQRYNKMPRKERETLWRRYAEEMLRKQNQVLHQKEDKYQDLKSRSSTDSGSYLLARVHDRK